MQSSSRSKLITDRLRAGEPPNIPILETGDLPEDGDWVLVDSMRVDRDELTDIDSDPNEPTKLTILSGDFE